MKTAIVIVAAAMCLMSACADRGYYRKSDTQRSYEEYVKKEPREQKKKKKECGPSTIFEGCWK